jgi:hypothetical protein
MGIIHKEIEIKRSKEFVWDAVRDVGAIHKRLAPRFPDSGADFFEADLLASTHLEI